MCSDFFFFQRSLKGVMEFFFLDQFILTLKSPKISSVKKRWHLRVFVSLFLCIKSALHFITNSTDSFSDSLPSFYFSACKMELGFRGWNNIFILLMFQIVGFSICSHLYFYEKLISAVIIVCWKQVGQSYTFHSRGAAGTGEAEIQLDVFTCLGAAAIH